MAFRGEQYMLKLEVPIDDPVLMQEFQNQADLGCIKSDDCISELLAKLRRTTHTGRELSCVVQLASA